MSDEDVKLVLTEIFSDLIDEETLAYFESMVKEVGSNKQYLRENLGPFIESYGIAETIEKSEEISDIICEKLRNLGIKSNEGEDEDDNPKLLEKTVFLANASNSQISDQDKETIDKLWGLEKVRKAKNDTIEYSEAASSKYERKSAREQRKWLEDLEAKFVGEEDDNKISTMTLPEISSKNKEKDIHVNKFSINYGGKILLEDANLKIVFGRRYGLVGKNGIGKTTLLKHMATFDIEGFPRHHRILHVKQEVKSSKKSVLEVVLEADVERTNLLNREQELLEKQNEMDVSSDEFSSTLSEIETIHERLDQIGAYNAESRAASILAGLQFTEEMQRSSTESLSGGWRMRVSLAGALLIEPDLLMLDEPTNHLDLEAVLWLENYLKSYPNTILLVSHDRAFLNEVCTDIIHFHKLKLDYYRGNFDMFEGTRKEMLVVQQKQHEAQKVKLDHMQEFVDKFRFNAKRASLVQSRIKAIEKEIVVEAVEDEEEFHFSFPDAGQLGIPIIQIEGVTFGYDPKVPLFKDVHLGIDLQSRIALVGPNGSGKSTLLKLVQGQLTPQDGFIRVNPQLRIGLFTQHHLDSFDLSVSPLQNMFDRWPKATEAELRAHLGRFEITGSDALKPMKFSSGGQKSRVAFACLTFAKPHVVIMDEPTNHLDMATIKALAESLQNFKGGVLVVSHDEHFITSICNEFWLIKDNRVKKLGDSFKEYKNSVIKKMANKKK